MVRQPAVAGKFYPGSAEQLKAQLAQMTPVSAEKRRVIGVIAPHAGYVYSGAVAGSLYGQIEIPPTVIILGPNHHGIGAPAALYPEGSWRTPLGDTPINAELARLIRHHAPLVSEDASAHIHEHSLEVQLPFLQMLQPDLSIVPLCLHLGYFASCKQVGEGLAAAIKEYGKDVLIVASSDMTHYESATAAREKDELALKEALALNPEGLLRVCGERKITMCGVVPSTVMLIAAKELGATKARLVKYATSGDVTGDQRQVVAYAALEVC